jgi:hypothetical protein
MPALSHFGNLLEVERIGQVPARRGLTAPSCPALKTVRVDVQAKSAPDVRAGRTRLKLPDPGVNPKTICCTATRKSHWQGRSFADFG